MICHSVLFSLADFTHNRGEVIFGKERAFSEHCTFSTHHNFPCILHFREFFHYERI